MAMHPTNSILKFIAIPVLAILFLLAFFSLIKGKHTEETMTKTSAPTVQNRASEDSAAESLDALTAEIKATRKDFSDIKKANDELRLANTALAQQVKDMQDNTRSHVDQEIRTLKEQFHGSTSNDNTPYVIHAAAGPQAITTVNDLTIIPINKEIESSTAPSGVSENKSTKEKTVFPVYTIPANATSVKDKLMTALVGRVPIKGVVVDPYPFKIVISDDNLAANGLRVPHLKQLIVSGYCEGDLVLNSVRGWVTSLTFVFDDGTITNTTSNNNDIGNFTKSNSLGFLSDKYGNPFIPGKKFLTNAPTVIGVDALLGGATGAANAYAQNQTTTSTSPIGGASTTSVTGSQARFVAGQALSGSTSEVKQWWDDRVSQSFDAVYVPPVDDNGCPIEIAVNFTKEIPIDYDKKGRKLSYENEFSGVVRQLD